MSKDILQPVPVKDWPHLQAKLKVDWPKFAYYYYWVENAITWKNKYQDTCIEIFSPNGDFTSTFVAISNFSLYIVIAFTQEGYGDVLKKALVETKQIDWNQGVHFAAVHKTILPVMHSVLDCVKQIRDIEVYPLFPGNYNYKSAEESLKVPIQVPEECYLRELNISDVPLIHSVWPHKDPERPDLSNKYLSTMVERNGGVGLVLKSDDSLISWALHTDWNGMGMLQTLEGHKRKGYAKVVINAFAKRLAERGISTTLFIIEGNTPSESLFRKLGFKSISPMSWVVLKRKVTQNVNKNIPFIYL